MSSFIIQLLIISVVGLMVQSAPVSVTDNHIHKRHATESQKALEKKLYCAATNVYKTGEPTVTLNIPIQ